MAGQRQRAALDLEAEVARVDPGELGVDDRARRIVGVEDVDGGAEAGAPRGEPDAAEHVAEQLVHLAAHPLEVREEIALAGHDRAAYPLHGGAPARDSHLVDGALARELDRPANARRASASARSPSSSSEMCVSTSRRALQRGGVLAGLAGRQVPARAVALGPRQRRLEEQQVGVGGEVVERVGRPVVGAEREAPAGRAAHLDGVGGHVVRDGLEAHGQRADARPAAPGRTR